MLHGHEFFLVVFFVYCLYLRTEIFSTVTHQNLQFRYHSVVMVSLWKVWSFGSHTAQGFFEGLRLRASEGLGFGASEILGLRV